MKFSYNWLQSYFDKELPRPDELAELLTIRSFEVEEVEKVGNDYLLDIDILPNRAHDCLSHYGLARECAAVLNVKIKIPNDKSNPKSKGQNDGSLQVSIVNEELCSRYAAYVIEGAEIKESSDWLKERLASVGQKPINNVVDITNYIIWELGQPLHAFDFSKIKGAKMNIRASKEGEELETLDGTTQKLDNETIIIEDSERLIDLAGIKGGANTQIDNKTDKVILQAAIFEPAHIRRASQKLGIRTDAAVRYMHGFDPELPPKALERAVEFLKETNPDIKVSQQIDIYPNPAKLKIISLDFSYVNKLLGTNLSDSEIQGILNRLGFASKSLRGGPSVAGPTRQSRSDAGKTPRLPRSARNDFTAPSYRLDIEIAEDIIEEIGRVYGYENIKEEPPRGILVTPRRNERVFWRGSARQIMTGFGFSEIYSYSLTPDYNMALEGTGEEMLELENPVSDEFMHFRMMLVQGILKSISRNSRNLDNVKLFEIGNVSYRSKEELREDEILGGAIYSASSADGGGFYELKGYIDELLNKLGITDFYYDLAFSKKDQVHGQLLHPSIRANIFIDSKFAGFAGEAHPAAREHLDIKGRVWIFELDFGKVANSAEEEHIYQKPSKYPEVVRDIALLVPRGVMVVDVLNLINASGGELLRDVDLFDMFEGENLPEGMKNLAFHLIFQSDERTLTSKEVANIMAKINNAIMENGWEVR